MHICIEPSFTKLNPVNLLDPDSKVHGANTGPTWALSAPDGPHVGPWTLLSVEENIARKYSVPILNWWLLLLQLWYGRSRIRGSFPDSKVHGAYMGPTWVLSSPGGPHVGPMNLAIRVAFYKGGIKLPVWSHHWTITENTNTFFCFIELIQHDRG